MVANRRNAAKSTGPRTAAGKARSRVNAFRHGFASAAQTITNSGEMPGNEKVYDALYQGLNKVYLARANLVGEIDRLLQQPSSEDLHKAVRRLGALQRYVALGFREIKNLTKKVQ
jgi:hypothetical protein